MYRESLRLPEFHRSPRKMWLVVRDPETAWIDVVRGLQVLVPDGAKLRQDDQVPVIEIAVVYWSSSVDHPVRCEPNLTARQCGTAPRAAQGRCR